MVRKHTQGGTAAGSGRVILCPDSSLGQILIGHVSKAANPNVAWWLKGRVKLLVRAHHHTLRRAQAVRSQASSREDTTTAGWLGSWRRLTCCQSKSCPSPVTLIWEAYQTSSCASVFELVAGKTTCGQATSKSGLAPNTFDMTANWESCLQGLGICGTSRRGCFLGPESQVGCGAGRGGKGREVEGRGGKGRGGAGREGAGRGGKGRHGFMQWEE